MKVNTDIEKLGLSDSDLKSIDLSGCTALKEFYAQCTGLKSLDVSECVNLEKLYVDSSHLRILDLSNNKALTEWSAKDQTIKFKAKLKEGKFVINMKRVLNPGFDLLYTIDPNAVFNYDYQTGMLTLNDGVDQFLFLTGMKVTVGGDNDEKYLPCTAAAEEGDSIISEPGDPVEEADSYIERFGDSLFKPEQSLTRGQAAAIFSRLLIDQYKVELDDDSDDSGNQDDSDHSRIDPGDINRFRPSDNQDDGDHSRIESGEEITRLNLSDIKGGWYESAVNYMVERGIMNGYPDGTFKPDNPLTRAELAKIVSELINLTDKKAPFSDISGHWAEKFIDAVYAKGIVGGYPDGTFKPDNGVTRAEAVKIFDKFFKKGVDKAGLEKLENPQDLKKFEDVPEAHWAYYEILEASNPHSYTEVDGKEVWIKILDKKTDK